jgi:hypothetical protein
MKKSYPYRLFAASLAMLMFFTSLSFSADVHFCNGDFKSFSLVGEASSCHTAKKSCSHHKDIGIEKDSERDCCKNKTIKIDDLDKDFNLSAEMELTDLQIQFLIFFVPKFFFVASPIKVKSDFPAMNDPLPSEDIYVLLGRFLI